MEQVSSQLGAVLSGEIWVTSPYSLEIGEDKCEAICTTTTEWTTFSKLELMTQHEFGYRLMVDDLPSAFRDAKRTKYGTGGKIPLG